MWINEIEQELAETPFMQEMEITEVTIENKLSKGPDKDQNHWIKQLTNLHP